MYFLGFNIIAFNFIDQESLFFSELLLSLILLKGTFYRSVDYPFQGPVMLFTLEQHHPTGIREGGKLLGNKMMVEYI